MDGDFWRRKWRANELGWHRATPNPMLVKHLPALGLGPGARLFVPLCGKTLDIRWLLENGFRVAGAELVESAVEALFAELGAAPSVEPAGRARRFSAEGIEVFAGDLFDLGRAALGPVDATYDRAALVALPAAMRPAYAAHVTQLSDGAPQLLITFSYDETLMDGPPFSVTDEEVRRLYGGTHEVELLESAEVEGGLTGFCPATEKVWRLRQIG